jgi:cytochrome P450 / NADPH-cytochrome P450 reductase
MLLQRFEFIDFADYKLETKQTLTIKPANFVIRVKMRSGRTTTAPLAAPSAALAPRPAGAPLPIAAPAPAADAGQTALLVLFGSNLGTAEQLAHEIADESSGNGFVPTVGSLDEHVGSLPNPDPDRCRATEAWGEADL